MPNNLEAVKGYLYLLEVILSEPFYESSRSATSPPQFCSLDLQEAFYRVIRPLAISGHWDDDHIAAIAARLHLDHNIMHDLKEHLLEASAVDLAGMQGAAKRAIKALHTDTFFALPGQHDVVRTSHGSRPGDSFADVVFGYLMARVLKSFEAQLATKNILSSFPDDPQPDFHEKGFSRSDGPGDPDGWPMLDG